MKKSLAALLAVVASGASFLLGARVGVTAFSQADAQYRASIAAGQLRLIEAQHLDELKQMKELELNARLADHGRYLESHFKWLWPDLASQDDEAITSAARYRATHPFEEPDLSKGADLSDPFIQGVVAGQKENRVLIEKVVSSYAL